MSCSVYIYLEKLNVEEKKWELYTLYDQKKNSSGQVEYEPLAFLETWGEIRDLFSENNNDQIDISLYSTLCPTNAPDNLYNLGEYLTEYTKGWYSEDEWPDIRFMTLAQMNKLLTDHPTIISEWEYDPITGKDVRTEEKNPLFYLRDRINLIMDLKNDYFYNSMCLSEIRLVFWLSY